MIGGSGEKVTLKLTAQHADMHNAFGPVGNFRHKMGVLDKWCGELGRNPRDIERTVAVRPEELAVLVNDDDRVNNGFKESSVVHNSHIN